MHELIPQDGLQKSSRWFKVRNHIAVNIDIICENILLKNHMQQQFSGSITHAQESYITKLP